MSKLLLAAAFGLTASLWAGPAMAGQAGVQAPAPVPDPSGQPPAPPADPDRARPPAGTPGAPGQPPPADAPAPAPAGATLPPADSPPLVRFIQLTFPTQGDTSVIDARTYLYYIQTQVSRPSDGVWVPYTEKTEESLLDDFKRLWATNFLDDLSI